MSATLSAAIAYATAGLPVMPLEPGTKAPHSMLQGPPICPGGVYHATTSLDRIAWWWGEDPDAGVGIATGRGVIVVDLDNLRAFDALEVEQARTLGSSATVTTSRGVHLYYRAPVGLRGACLGPAGDRKALEVKGAGSYVVAPPTRHPSGRVYRWVGDGPRTIPPAPAWLVQRLERRATPVRISERPAPRRMPLSDEEWLLGDRALLEVRARLGARSRSLGSNRRGALYAAARSLGEHVGAGLLDTERAAGELGQISVRLGLEAADAERHIRRGLAHGAGWPA